MKGKLFTRICCICKSNRVGLFPYLFGIRHCEACESAIKMAKEYKLFSPKGSKHYYLGTCTSDSIIL